jgi:threonylcarbamoyladenosine tRNA methylthiotransferase MtaB
MAPPEIITFGCRLNAYESEVMRANAATDDQDLVIVNTCAVTAESERQARQAIRRARRRRPAATLVVTGCAAQINPGQFADMAEVDRVIGNTEKLEPQAFADGPRVAVNDIMSVKETAGHLIDGMDGRARAFLQVQTGCDHRCTFCIIPYGRGNSRSVPIGAIVDQARRLVEGGYRELVLTGVDITDYGKDLPGQPGLGQMIRRLLAAVPELPRLRLSSIDPVEVDDDLWRLIAEEERLMPHLHLSLQAGSDMILKRMKRRHSRADALGFCDRARDLRPDVAFGADLIAGFPTETEAQFAESLDLVADCGLTWLHVFPYSPRPGTPAARMPQVPKADRKSRAAALRAVGEKERDRHLAAQIGRRLDVLIEDDATGRAEDFSAVTLDRPSRPGRIETVQIHGAAAGRLLGSTAA